ncbi:glycerophosphodiester phosphodiesterase [candidate division KSB1 bacterium]
MSDIRIIAHRGASGYAPENTMASFAKAVELGADEVELDVHQTADGRIVVIHDPVLNKTTNGHGRICRTDLAQLLKYDAGFWFDDSFKGEKVPLLEEILDFLKGKAKVIIEVKFGSRIYPGIEKNILDIITDIRMTDDVTVSSSKVTVLKAIKNISDQIELAKILTPRELWRPLFQTNSFIHRHSLFNRITELHPHWSFIDPRFMKWAKSANKKVIVWTVNKERRMRIAAGKGVDGIITNYPDKARLVISQN